MTDEKRKGPDWEAIEREFRAGQQSARAIAAKHGITEGAIRKKAKAEGWQRTLAGEVRKAVREKLVRADGTREGTQQQRASDAEVIESAAETGKQVVQSHRRDIRAGRDLVSRLFDELSATTSHIGTIEEEIEAATEDDKSGKRRAAMMRAVSLPSRASAMQALSGSLKNLVTLERQAYNLDSTPDDADGREGNPSESTFERFATALEGAAASKSGGTGGKSRVDREGTA
jgi:hypothetical protein